MTRPLAVFDIDGTLVDSRASIFQAATEASQALGLPEPEYDRVRRIVGLSLPEALRTLEPDLDDSDLERFVDAFKAVFLRMNTDPDFHEPLYDGAMDTLRRLRRDGWRLALATGQSRRGVERNLAREGWSDLFVSAHCAEDGPGKPDPAMLRAAMAAAGCEPHRSIMIGDTTHDIAMAIAAGVHPVGVTWGFHTEVELRAAGSGYVAHGFDDVLAHSKTILNAGGLG